MPHERTHTKTGLRVSGPDTERVWSNNARAAAVSIPITTHGMPVSCVLRPIHAYIRVHTCRRVYMRQVK